MELEVTAAELLISSQKAPLTNPLDPLATNPPRPPRPNPLNGCRRVFHSTPFPTSFFSPPTVLVAVFHRPTPPCRPYFFRPLFFLSIPLQAGPR